MTKTCLNTKSLVSHTNSFVSTMKSPPFGKNGFYPTIKLTHSMSNAVDDLHFFDFLAFFFIF